MRSNYIDTTTGASAALTRGFNNWMIVRISVPEARRDRGYGTRLLKRILADADQDGRVLVLCPIAGNGLTESQLRAWYARHGFRTRNALTLERLPTKEQAK